MGLLTRPGSAGPGRREPERMTVIQHLEDLRRALAIAFAAWLLCTVAGWFVSNDVLRLIQHRSGLERFIYLDLTGGFTLRLEVAVCVGTLAASPVIFWQVWWFVSPGLHRTEKQVVLPLIAATTFFFLTGVGLC